MKSSKVLSIALAVSILGGVSACSSDSKSSNHKVSSNSSGKSDKKNSSEGSSDSSNGKEKFTGNENILEYSKYKFNTSVKSIMPLMGSPVWTGKGTYVASSSKVVVTDGGSQNGSNNYYGFDIATGKQLWKLNLDAPVGVKDKIKLNNFTFKDVGDKMLAVWSGSVGGDALNSETDVSYAQSFDINSGKKLEEAKFDGKTTVDQYGIGYIITNTEKDNDVKFFYPQGFINDVDNRNKNLDSTTTSNYEKQGYYINGVIPIAKGIVIYDLVKNDNNDNNNYLQIANASNNKPLTGIINGGLDDNKKAISTTSPDANYIVYGGVLFNLKDYSKYKVLGKMSDTTMTFTSVNDDGDVLATAAATGPAKWIYIKHDSSKPQILDSLAVTQNEQAVDFDGGYFIRGDASSYSENGINWSGNVTIFKKKQL